MAERMVTLERSTNETQIELTLDLDGTGRYEIDTGFKFKFNPELLSLSAGLCVFRNLHCGCGIIFVAFAASAAF